MPDALSLRKLEMELTPAPTEDPTWTLGFDEFRHDQIPHRETLFTLANGYIGSRGSLEYALHYGTPGTYFAGVYDATPQHYSELANAPTWVEVQLTLGDHALDLRKGKVLEYQRRLDFKQGILFHKVRYEDNAGNITCIETARLVHATRAHVALLWGRVTAENWSGSIVLDTGLNGDVWNSTHLHQIKNCHFEGLELAAPEDGLVTVSGRTKRTEIGIALAARTALSRKSRIDLRLGREQISHRHVLRLPKGKSVSYTKTVAFASTRDAEEPSALARRELDAAVEAGAQGLIQEHVDQWAERWAHSDVVIGGDPLAQQSVRFNLFHLMSLGNAEDDDISIAAKGLHGEGYRGHIFWDTEIFLLPFFIYNNPDAAKNLLRYRFHRLPAARENARLDNWAGAKFPWESADTGRDVTPYLDGDFITGENVKPRAFHECQHHITADVAYGLIHYVTASGDVRFMREHGERLLLETAQFWASRAEWDHDRNAHVIRKVMGPDEFHNEIDNNVYTNHIAAWNLREALNVVHRLRQEEPEKLAQWKEEMGLREADFGRWNHMANSLFINYDPETKLFEQHEGYFQLEDHTVEYNENGRPIIRQEWWPKFQQTQLLKQADIVLMMTLFSDRFTAEQKKANFDYYEPRTTHLSSLSPNTYAIIGIEVGEYERAYRSFMMNARVDIHPTSFVPDGIHAASLGGCWMALTSGFGGMRIQRGDLVFRPWLPEHWESLRFQLLWRGRRLAFEITQDTFRAKVIQGREKVRMKVREEAVEVGPEGVEVALG